MWAGLGVDRHVLSELEPDIRSGGPQLRFVEVESVGRTLLFVCGREQIRNPHFFTEAPLEIKAGIILFCSSFKVT